MSKELIGKKLLILGATSSEISLVRRAQQLGVYVIVTDYNTDHLKSPAKDVADEFWDISWSDIDSLATCCKEKHVDGVTAGYSEFRIEAMIKLCERLNLPCYSTYEQLEITRDKLKFKDFCRSCGVPVVKEFGSAEDVTEFPVIVKPVDRAGSIGISIANDNAELIEAYNYAMEKSVCKQVIIEKFIQDGTKFDVYYGVENGIITELSTCDTINAKTNGSEKVVQSCWLYPSHYEDLFHQSVDGLLRRMIEKMQIRYGCIFFSGFVNQDKTFTFFECGFRLEGAHQYAYVKQRGLYDYNDLFIYHALTNDTADMERGEALDHTLKFADVNFYAKRGTIAEITGVNQIEMMPECILSLLRAYIGQNCDDSKAILDKIAQFGFASNNPLVLYKQVKQLYQNFEVRDVNNEDMIYDKIDAEKIINWWG